MQKFQRELANVTQEKDEHIATLNHELEEKTTSIAYLVTQLHRSKRLLQKSLEDERSLASSRASDRDQVIKPSPPKESPPEAAYKTGLITKRLRRTYSTPPVEARSYVPRLHRNRQDSPEAPVTFPHSQPFRGANTVSLSSIEAKRAPEKISSFYHPLNAPVTPSHWIKQHPAVSSTEEFEAPSQQFINRTKHSRQTQQCKLPLRQQPKVVLPPIRPDTPPQAISNATLKSSNVTLDHPNSALTRNQRLQRRVLATRVSSSVSYQQAVIDDVDREEEEEELDEEEEAVEGTLMVRQGLGSQSSWRQLHQSHAK